MQIGVEVGTFNYSEQDLRDVIKFYNLNPIQTQLLKQGEIVKPMEHVYLERLYKDGA
ncbi:DUF1837 domain-containing protein [Escherichia phage EcS1]|uniref:DUF1837 domain-containing protein n=1 Tax=Escherichia phage EcS1 TaxID=2083276 RepID=A0A2Z5ZC41_9CAUD|nr:DUF1837 domain-containing protein [Escherichia phage EcS1]BBC78198.1 DUF1837 domain-containing protein [Escherichia phage EcS1]